MVQNFGTIRCSGSSGDDRVATTSIRPYLVGYMTDNIDRVVFEDATLGLFPLEARASSIAELGMAKKVGAGHLGSCIEKIISFGQLKDPAFIPACWQGEEAGGISWATAQNEFIGALIHLKHSGYTFRKCERVVGEAHLTSTAKL